MKKTYSKPQIFMVSTEVLTYSRPLIVIYVAKKTSIMYPSCTLTSSLYIYAHFAHKKRIKTYNSRDSLVVTHPTTNRPACGLSTAERTGSPVFHTLWSYVMVCSMNREYDRSIGRVKVVVVSNTIYGVAAGTSRWLPNGDYDQDIYNIYKRAPPLTQS